MDSSTEPRIIPLLVDLLSEVLPSDPRKRPSLTVGCDLPLPSFIKRETREVIASSHETEETCYLSHETEESSVLSHETEESSNSSHETEESSNSSHETEENNGVYPYTPCPNHPSTNSDTFCFTCEHLICPSCVNHNNHNIATTDAALVKVRKELAGFKKTLIKNMAASSDHRSRIITEFRKVYEGSNCYEEVVDDIYRSMSELSELLPGMLLQMREEYAETTQGVADLRRAYRADKLTEMLEATEEISAGLGEETLSSGLSFLARQRDRLDVSVLRPDKLKIPTAPPPLRELRDALENAVDGLRPEVTLPRSVLLALVAKDAEDSLEKSTVVSVTSQRNQRSGPLLSCYAVKQEPSGKALPPPSIVPTGHQTPPTVAKQQQTRNGYHPQHQHPPVNVAKQQHVPEIPIKQPQVRDGYHPQQMQPAATVAELRLRPITVAKQTPPPVTVVEQLQPSHYGIAQMPARVSVVNQRQAKATAVNRQIFNRTESEKHAKVSVAKHKRTKATVVNQQQANATMVKSKQGKSTVVTPNLANATVVERKRAKSTVVKQQQSKANPVKQQQAKDTVVEQEQVRNDPVLANPATTTSPGNSVGLDQNGGGQQVKVPCSLVQIRWNRKQKPNSTGNGTSPNAPKRQSVKRKIPWREYLENCLPTKIKSARKNGNKNSPPLPKRKGAMFTAGNHGSVNITGTNGLTHGNHGNRNVKATTGLTHVYKSRIVHSVCIDEGKSCLLVRFMAGTSQTCDPPFRLLSYQGVVVEEFGTPLLDLLDDVSRNRGMCKDTLRDVYAMPVSSPGPGPDSPAERLLLVSGRTFSTRPLVDHVVISNLEYCETEDCFIQVEEGSGRMQFTCAATGARLRSIVRDPGHMSISFSVGMVTYQPVFAELCVNSEPPQGLVLRVTDRQGAQLWSHLISPTSGDRQGAPLWSHLISPSSDEHQGALKRQFSVAVCPDGEILVCSPRKLVAFWRENGRTCWRVVTTFSGGDVSDQTSCDVVCDGTSPVAAVCRVSRGPGGDASMIHIVKGREVK